MMMDHSTVMDQSQLPNRKFTAWPPRPPPPANQTSQKPTFTPQRSTWNLKNPGEIRRSSSSRRFHPKKRFSCRFAPFAPRNTTSFLMRAKKSGGIAPFVSPYPVTPATLPTPILSPSHEALVDMAREEWGVDGYGSMNGLIRLRSPGQESDEDDGGVKSDVERRLDHDLSRFEMVYPNTNRVEFGLENRVDDQDTHIAKLEEENMILKERLFMMETELEGFRRRVQWLEDGGCGDGDGGRKKTLLRSLD